MTKVPKKMKSLFPIFLLIFHSSLVLSLSPTILQKVKGAMQISTGDPINHKRACQAWEDILLGEESANLPPQIASLAFCLYGSSLASCGRDKKAVVAFDQAQTSCGSKKEEETVTLNIGLARGRTLQRLMRYREAMDQFRYLGQLNIQLKQYKDGIEASIASATCALRCKDILQAISILQETLDAVQVELIENEIAIRAYGNLCGMLGTVIWMNSLNETAIDTKFDGRKIMNLLKSGSKYFFLYRWLEFLASRSHINSSLPGRKVESKGSISIANAIFRDDENYINFSDLSSINVSAFDEPQSIILDNKLMLHHLLSSRNNASSFWPLGFDLPIEADKFSDVTHKLEKRRKMNRHWILKDPVGYGSHGNKIVSGAEALSISKNTEGYLCQQIIPKPLLMNGRTFSIRLYVVYFVGSVNPDVYISREGLIKLASTKFDLLLAGQNSDLTDDIFMTNSARGDDMDQHDLNFLEDFFRHSGWSYDLFWQKLRLIVASVMRAYCEESDSCVSAQKTASVEPKIHLAQFQLPKIYGFDLLVDEELSPWLIEVNRFPGLEPRNEKDKRVKQVVVEAAWILAAEKANIPLEIISLKQQQSASATQIAQTKRVLEPVLLYERHC